MRQGLARPLRRGLAGLIVAGTVPLALQAASMAGPSDGPERADTPRAPTEPEIGARHPDMARMHEEMLADHPDMARMHDEMLADHPDMARMHAEMTTGK